MADSGLVACFSYLAAAELWRVAEYPVANAGAQVLDIEHSVAADAPMTAAVLSALAVPTLLLSNDVGDDADGMRVHAWLRRHRVGTTTSMAPGRYTPRIVVVGDNRQTRTWFAHLPGVSQDLETVDLTPLTGAALAYIDSYQIIESSAICAIRVARSAGTPLLLNLGGSQLTSSTREAVQRYSDLIVQTNAPGDDLTDATSLAHYLQAATGAGWVIVTAGAAGAVALTSRQQFVAEAFRVSVRHSHCAGAAFSGGLLYGLLRNWPMDESLRLACASGALRCARAQTEPMPTLRELLDCIGSRDRAEVSAA